MLYTGGKKLRNRVKLSTKVKMCVPNLAVVRRFDCNVNMPTGIAVNSAGEIVVAEHDGKIDTYNNMGQKQQTIDTKQHEFCALYSVAVDPEDNIYCVSCSLKSILTGSRLGEDVHIHQVGNQSSFDIAIVGDEVMVCARDNKGSVDVYNKKLQHKRQIVGQNMGTFYSVAADSNGSLFATDWSNGCIRVFSNAGDFLYDFGTINQPHYLCISGQYVYLTEFGNNRVLVFTIEGQLVLSFGGSGTTQGLFNAPYGVCVDEDGFVYISDCLNNRIQVF